MENKEQQKAQNFLLKVIIGGVPSGAMLMLPILSKEAPNIVIAGATLGLFLVALYAFVFDFEKYLFERNSLPINTENREAIKNSIKAIKTETGKELSETEFLNDVLSRYIDERKIQYLNYPTVDFFKTPDMNKIKQSNNNQNKE